MPGLPASSILQDITRGCEYVVSGASDEVGIESARLQAFAAELDPEDVRAAADQALPRLPIRFDGLQSEVNLVALQRLLDFGSGYDALLRQTTGRGARETMQFGVFGLHISGKALDADFLSSLSGFALADYFGFPAQVDAQLQPGIYISRPVRPALLSLVEGPLAGLSERMRAVLHGAGDALATAGARDLGALVLQLLDARHATGQPASAAALVAGLAEAVPGFADVGDWQGRPVPLHRKAAGLAGDLAARFGGEDARFAFADAADLPADSDTSTRTINTCIQDCRHWRACFALHAEIKSAVEPGSALIAWLFHLGVLQAHENLEAEVHEGENVPSGGRETALRAAAVAACARIAAAAPGGLTAGQVGAYLLAQAGSAPEDAPVGHVTRDTVAY